MSLLSEFKSFAMRGNVIDMAVGIIIGAAFNKVVSSLVADIFMPPLGMLIGGVDFVDLAVVLREAEGGQAAVTLGYGLFIKNVIDFLIVALAVFIAVKVINSMRRKEADVPPPPNPPSKQEVLLTDIRDLLKAQQRD
ncbi:large conductance mechanosensitive channel [Halopseudomonas xinjiangensis]|uniref:Large-conductance mechanosensitive channel n=1 Tax=Halopseudomonas xinjiangensis TaxID=487184 RepID=A0A1H1LW04_9GAMM|nr:large-conductance mechanosensitive channel protein MscL [Halopseudomonas xinjiangensis]SDR78716.1 large conductance mechanosensitive channel [Halopseudomonas xinjiangensis]